MLELVKFTKTGGPLTKRISLALDGTLVSDGSACVMARGKAERVKIADIDELATLIASEFMLVSLRRLSRWTSR